MKRAVLSPLLGVGLAIAAGLSAPARAVLCAADQVPAATLLVPHFRVDLDACGDDNGLDTVITVVNTQAASVVVHMTLWTDWGVPTINHSMYLTGFDQQSIDLAAAFCDGELPLTGPTIFSNHGELSDTPPALPSCELIEPSLANPLLVAAFLDRLRNGHTGVFDSSFGGCAGTDHGDNIARGYVTLDVVADCNVLFPSDVDYFNGVALSDNVLMGHYLYRGGSVFQSLPAVHIEADASGSVISDGDHSFYGRYVGGDGRDRREPLPSVFSANVSNLIGSSELLVWRETVAGAPATCGGSPPGIPIAQPDLLAFDEEENPLVIFADIDLATNSVPIGGLLPPGLIDLGWLVLDERHDGVVGIYGDDRAQAWVTYLNADDPVASMVGRQTFVLDNGCGGQDFQLPHRIFADGFESGDSTAW